MAINFTKPIRYIATKEEIKVLFHDNISVLFIFCGILDNDSNRRSSSIKSFEKDFENVPKESQKIKGFIGLSTSKETGTVYCTSVVYESKEKLLKCCGGYTTIVEINATEGEVQQ
jgi:hypothetical protein